MLNEKALDIAMLVLDVDGVLTDGAIVYAEGCTELKAFHTHDGLGIRLALSSGLAVAIVTGRTSQALERRATELGVTRLVQGVTNKAEAVKKLAEELSIKLTQVAFLGDDLVDLPAMRRVGLAMAVADAVDEVRSAADVVTRKTGGQGAVREAIEFLLRTQGRWESAVTSYLSDRE
jgi:3-deoxy-D-manno-octulosonate 8-phosphate phosphatase (KDO 8-P phosphatase)